MADIMIRNVEAFRADVSKSMGVEDASETYCQVWPFVKQGLTLLKQIAPSIPGIGLFVGFAVDIVIAAGDAAAKALCSDSAGRDATIAEMHDYSAEPDETGSTV